MLSYEEIVANVPYAQQLGFKVVEEGGSGAEFELSPEERFIGNPMLRAFHGGIICGFMECTMSATVQRLVDVSSPVLLINQTTSFLGSANIDTPLRVRTELTKSGKRIIGVSARAYQASDTLYVAKCSALFRLASVA